MERAGVWRNTAKAGLVAGSIVLASTGCAEKYTVKPEEPAKVLKTTFTAAHEKTVNDGCAYGQDGVCYLYYTHQEHVPDAWSVTVEQCKDGPIRNSGDDICSTSTFAISRESYNELHEGHVVTISGQYVTIIPR